MENKNMERAYLIDGPKSGEQTPNLFEGAKFGDVFITCYRRKAIYHKCTFREGGKRWYHLIVDDGTSVRVYPNGYDRGEYRHVVARYQEPIDEKKLEEEAEEAVWEGATSTSTEAHIAYCQGFKDGYRKAKEV